jgi:hypothetical protein
MRRLGAIRTETARQNHEIIPHFPALSGRKKRGKMLQKPTSDRLGTAHRRPRADPDARSPRGDASGRPAVAPTKGGITM